MAGKGAVETGWSEVDLGGASENGAKPAGVKAGEKTAGVKEKDVPEDVDEEVPELINRLKGPDVTKRASSMRALAKIAAALGPERTRDELVPFLTDTIEDEDQVMEALGEGFGTITGMLGGLKYLHVMLAPLEFLCRLEHSKIRTNAVASVRKLTEEFTEEQLEEKSEFGLKHLLPMVHRLKEEKIFSPRVSACELLPIAISCLLKDEPNLFREPIVLYKQLARDETAAVRREAANRIADIAEVVAIVEPTFIENEIFPLFRELSEDNQDSVRILAIKSAPILISILPDEIRDTMCIPVLRSMSQDRAWRVRYMFADQLIDICDSVSHKVVRDELLPAFLSLLKDSETEVRTAIASTVSMVTQRIANSAENDPVLTGVDIVVRDILPVVQELVNDPSQFVRAALAQSIMGLAPVLGEDLTGQELLEMVLVLLKDEFPTVRLNVISTLNSVSIVMGMRALSDELLPAIVDLAEDRSWRVRMAIIDHIPLLAKQLGQDLFDEEMRLSDVCLTWLGDCVWSIREAAIYNLKHLTEVFGEEWAQINIVPQLVELFTKSSNYLYRMTALYAIGILSEVVGPEVVEADFLPLVANFACHDPVPNVRFSAAKTLEILIPYVREELHRSTIRPCLETVLSGSEKDIDVLYFAKAALAKVAV